MLGGSVDRVVQARRGRPGKPKHPEPRAGKSAVRRIVVARGDRPDLRETIPQGRQPKKTFPMKTLRSFLSDERGLETVEYAVIGGLIVVALITIIGLLSDSIVAKFTQLNDAISG
jgi:Flp pilus assembly pilin Flp